MTAKVYTDKEFDQMNWHDCKIHAIAFDPKEFKLLLDIDYILKWEEPSKQGGYYKFLVSPATLIFENVSNLTLGIESELEIIIDSITKENIRPAVNLKAVSQFDWKIELVDGEIGFTSIGYKLFLRKDPVTQENQAIDLKARGGICFEIPKHT